MRNSGLRDPPAASHSCQQLPAQDRAAGASPGEPSRIPSSRTLCRAPLPCSAHPHSWNVGETQSCPPREENTSAGALRPGKRLIHLAAITVSSKSLYMGQVPHSTHPQRHFSPPGEKSSPERPGDGKGKGKEEGGNRGSNGPSRKP